MLRKRNARIDSKHKQDALEKAYIDVGITESQKKSWEKDTKLKSTIIYANSKEQSKAVVEHF